MPSTMISGWFWPRIEPPPRATTRTEPNGLLEFVTCSPATLPCSSPNTFVLGTCVNRSAEMVCAAYGSVRCSRSMPSAVVTVTASSSTAWNRMATVRVRHGLDGRTDDGHPDAGERLPGARILHLTDHVCGLLCERHPW